MGEIKTRVNNASVTDFIETVDNANRRKDGFVLLDLFTKVTGESAKLWGPSIIGFGQYHYKSERSSQEGDWPLIAFSPRKQSLTLYISHGMNDYSELLGKLGKHKTSKGCLYINKLTDVYIDVLEQLIEKSYLDAKEKLT